MDSAVPEIRIRSLNQRVPRADRDFVLYWMIAHRRVEWNFSLERAIDWCHEFNKPLLIFEPLRCDYKWASDRLHRFVLQGMADQRARLADTHIGYYPYVEPQKKASQGLLAALAERACLIVTDDFPSFFIPRMLTHVGRTIGTAIEAIDSNGILPMRAVERIFPSAHSFRRILQNNLDEHLRQFPKEHPLTGHSLPNMERVPSSITDTWPAASDETLTATTGTLASLPIDHEVAPAVFDGGSVAANKQLNSFLKNNLSRYGDGRNHPDDDAASGLSPYLHFGHISTHQVFDAVARSEEWSPAKLGSERRGARHGYWNMSESAESFLDELITWRELGYNMCSHREDYATFNSLPEWALETLGQHSQDKREHIYSQREFEAAQTHDRVWNAAQNQLVTEGKLHNYLRMLWGKKILEWTSTPQDALNVMIHLNNKYAVDGRNPNSYSGIFWVLGRYDRAWGPERPIYGKIRYMSSDNTVKKLHIDEYLDRYAPENDQSRLFD